MEQGSTKAELVFRAELRQIQLDEIRGLVLQIFDQLCPPDFWEIAASSTGEYHPTYALGKGGLVRHTKSAIFWMNQLLPLFTDNSKSIITDVAVSALLLHDLFKAISPSNLRQTQYADVPLNQTHGLILADEIDGLLSQMVKGDLFVYGHQISEAVRYHMGRWTLGYDNSFTWLLEQSTNKLVHLSDFIASRRLENHPYYPAPANV